MSYMVRFVVSHSFNWIIKDHNEFKSLTNNDSIHTLAGQWGYPFILAKIRSPGAYVAMLMGLCFTEFVWSILLSLKLLKQRKTVKSWRRDLQLIGCTGDKDVKWRRRIIWQIDITDEIEAKKRARNEGRPMPRLWTNEWMEINRIVNRTCRFLFGNDYVDFTNNCQYSIDTHKPLRWKLPKV